MLKFIFLIFFIATLSVSCGDIPQITEDVCTITQQICDYANALCDVAQKVSLHSDKQNIITELYFIKQDLALYSNALQDPKIFEDSTRVNNLKFELWKIREKLKSTLIESNTYKQKTQTKIKSED